MNDPKLLVSMLEPFKPNLKLVIESTFNITSTKRFYGVLPEGQPIGLVVATAQGSDSRGVVG